MLPVSLTGGLRSWAVVACLVVGPACAGAPGPALPQGSQMEGPVLTVTNHHPHHVEVTVVPYQSSSIRLGTVRVESVRRMHIPRTVDGLEMQLQLRCVRSGEVYATRYFRPARDRDVSLSVESLLRLSDFRARR